MSEGEKGDEVVVIQALHALGMQYVGDHSAGEREPQKAEHALIQKVDMDAINTTANTRVAEYTKQKAEKRGGREREPAGGHKESKPHCREDVRVRERS